MSSRLHIRDGTLAQQQEQWRSSFGVVEEVLITSFCVVFTLEEIRDQSKIGFSVGQSMAVQAL